MPQDEREDLLRARKHDPAETHGRDSELEDLDSELVRAFLGKPTADEPEPDETPAEPLPEGVSQLEADAAALAGIPNDDIEAWLAEEFPAWYGSAARKMGCSPALAISLDLWGAVVAHRAGAKARPNWVEKGTRKKPTPRGERNHQGLLLRDRTGKLEDASWVIASDWRTSIEGEIGLPSVIELSGWAQDLRRLSQAADPSAQQSQRGSLSHVGDVRGVTLAFLTATTLMTGGTWYWRASVRLQQALAWLFAIPHLGFGEMDAASWLWRSDGSNYTSDRLDRLEDDLQEWAKRSAKRMRLNAREQHELEELLAPKVVQIAGGRWDERSRTVRVQQRPTSRTSGESLSAQVARWEDDGGLPEKA